MATLNSAEIFKPSSQKKILETCCPLSHGVLSAVSAKELQNKKEQFLSLLGKQGSAEAEYLFLSLSLISLSDSLLHKLSQSDGRQMSEFKVALVAANFEAALSLGIEITEELLEGKLAPIKLCGLWLRAIDLSKEVGGLLFELQSRDKRETGQLAKELVNSRQVILEEYSKIGDGTPSSRKISQHLGL